MPSKVDPQSPAARIAAKFDKKGNPRAAGLANAIGKTASTVQRWLNSGTIDAKYHYRIVIEARARSIKIKPEDFIDSRAFAKPASDPAEVNA